MCGVTSGESEEVITEAMTFLKTVLPTNAFYGKGFSGPEICITDDSDAERAALKNIWPGTTFLLCIFHHLQSWWSWLWDAKHGIAKEHRQSIMMLVKSMLYTPNEQDFHQKYFAIMKETPDHYTTKNNQPSPKIGAVLGASIRMGSLVQSKQNDEGKSY